VEIDEDQVLQTAGPSAADRALAARQAKTGAAKTAVAPGSGTSGGEMRQAG
jgi:hypothetical protein